MGLWYKRGQIARFGQSGYEGLRIGLIAIAFLLVAPWKAFAYLGNRGSDLWVVQFIGHGMSEAG